MPILDADYSNIDQEKMAEAIGLKPKHIPLLIGSFLGESEQILSELEEFIDNKDYENIKSKAHAIKGSSGNLRFDEIYNMCKEMEFAAANAEDDFDYNGYITAIKSAIATIPN